jgi:SAM-dependent methyltransferase
MSVLRHVLQHRHWGIQPHDIVLDLGSGGAPIFRADILVDKYTDSDFQREFGMVADRPTICADGAHLPFRDKVIDFVYCSHVIEHIPNPKPFLAEVARVGKRGLLEAPHGDYEKIHPRDLHLWYVYSNSQKLTLIQKPTGNEYPDIAAMYSRIRKSFRDYYKFVAQNWNTLNTRHFWTDTIESEIVLDDRFDIDKFSRVTRMDMQPETTKFKVPFSSRAKSLLHMCLHKLFCPHIDLASLLQCPKCKAEVSLSVGTIRCSGCDAIYPISGKVINMDVTTLP